MPDGLLYIVPTPIGDIEDMSFRAVQTLRQADLIAAEDPRVTRKLLRHFEIDTELLRFPSRRDSMEIVLAYLVEGRTVALVCDAGTPAIADPGAALVRAALDRKFRVVALPGPCAALVALIESGISPHRFAFDGFPPRGRADRCAFFARLAGEERTIVLYESAAYLRSTLEMLCRCLGANRSIAIARDLTTSRAYLWRGALAEACRAAAFASPRGRYTLVIAGYNRR